MTTTTTTTTDGFVMRQGRRIAVTTTLYAAPTRKRKAFAAQWIKLPRHWLTALLNTRSANTYRLATLILLAAFERTYRGGEIVLSTHMTGGMSRSSKVRAAAELVRLGLIKTKQEGRQAIRVTNISIK
jgi:hypothetical protein